MSDASTPAPMLPPHAAHHLTHALSDYLATSFSLTDPEAYAALTDFLHDPEDGVFRGPYLRARLPYAPTTRTSPLEWMPAGFTPYEHQISAFTRLTSARGHTPEPTLVLTGTGSGKTEAFLYPIIDHIVRTGPGGGIKALILYPMNALATDQAGRLAKLLSSDPRLADVTAGIYTGESGEDGETAVSADGLITSRAAMRVSPPDILLTNYKMLDQLLLRTDDHALWQHSAATLSYLVLDEFHTYDGAQGSDVALLLRRLALTLARYRGDDEVGLGPVCPVATSATMGSGSTSDTDPTESIRVFASTVFGVPFGADALVAETPLDLDEWRRLIASRFGHAPGGSEPTTDDVADIVRAVREHPDETAEAIDTAMTTRLLGLDADAETDAVVSAYAAHPFIRRLLEALATPIGLSDPSGDDLVHRIFDEPTLRQLATDETAGEDLAALFLTLACSWMAYLRASLTAADPARGRLLPGLDTHLWVRAVSRIDRKVNATGFRWSDDGESLDDDCWMAAIYCRHCGASGWMAADQPGTDVGLTVAPRTVRQTVAAQPRRQRPLIYAGADVTPSTPGVTWFDWRAERLLHAPDGDEIANGAVVAVRTYTGPDAEAAAAYSRCPSCGDGDAIRYVGASKSTLLSVALSTLFGSPDIPAAEKRTLVFTDSVQDAAHAAGFFQSRTWALNWRTRIAAAIGTEHTLPLSGVTSRIINATPTHSSASHLRERFQLLPKTLAYMKRFRPFWTASSSRAKQRRDGEPAKQRLEADTILEFGERADLHRSLTSTGTVSVRVDVDDATLVEAAREATAAHAVMLPGTDEERVLLRWALGILEIIRHSGGIDHPFYRRYIEADGNEFLLRDAHARFMGVPSFPKHQPPQFPVLGPRPNRQSGLVPVAEATSRYVRFTARTLGVGFAAGACVTDLLKALICAGVLEDITTRSGAHVAALRPEMLRVSTSDAGAVECDTCRNRWGVHAAVARGLTDAACLTPSCPGHLEAVAIADGYYRRLYTSNTPRSLVTAEHTSLIDPTERHRIEAGFAASDPSLLAPDAPNVLVATPTLEMGIDIGQLTTVMLASIPRTVASYVQRVGRAGRLAGNSLIIAIDAGRSRTLAQLDRPLDVIDGDVAAPIAYLCAPLILQRQFLAYLIDTLDPETYHRPRVASDLFSPRKTPLPSLPDSLSSLKPEIVAARLKEFLASLGDAVTDDVAASLTSWALGETSPSLPEALTDATLTWRTEVSRLKARRKTLLERRDSLRESCPNDPGNSDDPDTRRDYRDILAALKATHSRLSSLTDSFWVASLETYGLLPNFTLLDDTVSLSVDIAHYSEGEGGSVEITTEQRDYERGVSRALTELAPGAVFYVSNMAARIDTVDHGPDAADVQRWQLCPECSYSHVIEESGSTERLRTCPQCRSPRFGDRDQVVPVLPLRHVSATVDPTRSAISDSSSERRIVPFSVLHTFAAEKTPDNIRQAWHLDNGFGAVSLRRATLRWLNLGWGAGPTVNVGSCQVKRPLFKVCRYCGHVDSQAGANSAWDHQPWCRLRHSHDEDTVEYALGRTLHTEALQIDLPVQLACDSYSLPSLMAAIPYGIAKIFGNAPANLTLEPAPLGGTHAQRWALLLIDEIPGGTGYLSRFSSPPDLRHLLEVTYDALTTCECASTGEAACPRCLLGYTTAPGNVSRLAALSALATILDPSGHPPANDVPTRACDFPDWEPTYTPAGDAPVGSHLEAYFRQVIRRAAQARGYDVRDSARSSSEMTLTINNRRWRLIEQKAYDTPATRPDFTFHTDDPHIRDVCVYTDGWRYHRGSDNLDRDIYLRNALNDERQRPLVLTWRDVADYDEQARSLHHTPRIPNQHPWWVAPSLDPQVAAHLGLSVDMLANLRVAPIDLLLAYLEHPERPWDKLPNAALTHLYNTAGDSQRPGSIVPTEEGETVLDFPEHAISVHACGPHTQIHYDPRRADDQDACNGLWTIANILWFCPDGIDIVLGATTPSAAEEAAATDATAELPPEWAAAAEEFDGEDDILVAITGLAHAHVRTPDRLGDEINGVPILAGWDDARLLLIEEGSEDTERLSADGYALYTPDQWRTIAATLAPDKEQ